MLSSKVREKQVNLKATLNKALEEDPYFRERFKNANLEGKIQGWGLPLGSKKRNISGDGFMLVGDAASLIDPFTGEGIGNAMLSAKIAVDTAERAMKADDFSASTLNQYDKAVYKKLWKELQLSHQLQKLSTKPWLFNFVVNRIQKSKGLQELFTTMFKDVDLRKQMKNPLFYFRLLFR
jgi:flavin-dependent dehydrogenase